MNPVMLVNDISGIFSYLPGGMPGFIITVFGLVFAATAAHALYRKFFPKSPNLPKMPKPPAALLKGAEADKKDKTAEVSEDKEKPGFSLRDLWPFSKKPKAKIRRISNKNLEKSFQLNLNQLQDHVSSPYDIPWFLMLGETGAGKSTALLNSGLPQPFGNPPDFDNPSHEKGCDWWFFNEGIVLDMNGDSILYQDETTDQYVSDDKGWQSLLTLLQHKRTKRPIDGVILTIPATDLVGEQRAAREVMQNKAEQLYEKLCTAQKILGMRVPVYILVSKCDVVSGFQDFCQVLPERLTQDIFGWSNPFSLETVYNSNLVETAFQKLYQDLNETQLELVTVANEKISNNDSFLLFPHEMRPVFKQLRIYLDRVFKTSTYHEPFFFRGIYFTGDSGIQHLGNLEDDTLSATGHATSDDLAFAAETQKVRQPKPTPVFLTHFLRDKVFPESGIARPVNRVYKSQNKVLWTTQAAIAGVLVTGVGLQWYAFRQVDEAQITLVPLYRQVMTDTENLRELKINVRFDDTYKAELQRAQQTAAMNLLNNMAKVETDTLESVWIPPSLFSQVDKKLVLALAAAYDRLIVKWLYIGLHEQSRYLTDEPLEHHEHYLLLEENQEDGENITELAEFKNITAFIERLEQLQKNTQRYNHLQQAEDKTKSMADLVEYLYHLSLPSTFYTHAELYTKAIANAHYPHFDLDNYRPHANRQLVQLQEELLNRLFQNNTLNQRISTLQQALDELEQSSRHTQWNTILSGLNDDIANIESYLEQTEYAWVSSAKFDLGAEFDYLLQGIRKNTLYGDTVYEEFRETVKTEFFALRAQLQSYRSDLVGPLMKPRSAKLSKEARKLLKKKKKKKQKKSKDKNLVLSPAVIRLKKILSAFLANDFMAEVSSERQFQADLPLNKRLIWETDKLQKAVNLATSFQHFIDRDLKRFPDNLKEIAKNAGHFQLHANLRDLIAQAQTVEMAPRAIGAEYERSVRTEVENFSEASPLLSWLLQVFDVLKSAKSFQEKYANTYKDLEALSALQAYRLLARINKLLDEDDLYRPKDTQFFAEQNQGKSLPLLAFAVTDKTELDYYLSVQRDRVYYLARTYAHPILEFISGKKLPAALGSSVVVPRWTRIYQELFKYDSEKPDNSLAALENYILTELDDVNADNCYSRLQAIQQMPATGDYFLQKREALQLLLLKHCSKEQIYLAADKDKGNLQSLTTQLKLSEAMYWDADQLRSAVTEAEKFAKFITEEVPKLPEAEQATTRNKTLSQFHDKIIDQIARAQMLAPHQWQQGVQFEEGLRGEVQNFTEAAPMLDWFIAFLTQLSAEESTAQQQYQQSLDALIKLGTLQAYHLLKHSSKLLSSSALYTPGEVEYFISRATPVALSKLAFGSNDVTELDYYLTGQRQRVGNLAKNYALPLLSFLAGKPVPEQYQAGEYIPLWNQLYQELFKYENETPDNAVAKLEHFIRQDLDQINSINCYSRLYDSEFQRDQGNFFQRKLSALRYTLFEQCRQTQYYLASPVPGMQPLAKKIPLNGWLYWDLEKLQQAIASAENFGKFIDEDVVKWSEDRQNNVNDRGYTQFHTHIMNLIAKAQQEQPKAWQSGQSFEEGVDQATQNFSKAQPLLDWLIQFFNHVAKANTDQAQRFTESSEALAKLGTVQAYTLFKQVTKLLQQSTLYTPAQEEYFIPRQGPFRLTQLAFGSNDVAELDYYLAGQRQRVGSLAKTYALPLLSFLAGKPVPEQYQAGEYIPLWNQLYQALFSYEKETPDNSVAKLETFIRQDMDQLNPTNCYSRLYDSEFQQDQGDFFQRKLAKLRYTLLEQCRQTQMYLTGNMNTEGMRQLTTQLPLNGWLYWDVEHLGQAVASAENFGNFVTEELPKWPEVQQATVKSKGYAQFHTHIIDLIARAQRVKPQQWRRGQQFEESVDQAMQNFNEAVPLLDWLIQFFNQVSKADTTEQGTFADSRDAVTQLTVIQAHRLLKHTAQLLRSSHLYRPQQRRFFLDWNGDNKLSSVAFGTGDQKELEFYLRVQQDRVRFLATRYAQPLLKFLGEKTLPTQYGSQNAMPMWSRIYAEMFKYDNEDPNNALAKLEDFILFGIDKINLGNCYSNLPEAGRQHGDYFLARLSELQNLLFQQCRFMADFEAYRRYYIVQDYFNQNLAARFPFAETSAESFFSEAAPSEIKDFFTIYEQYGQGLLDYLSNSRSFGQSRNAAIAFLDKIERVKIFLQPVLIQSLPLKRPVYDIVVDFRVNQGQESGANQIIGWELEKTTPGVNYFQNGIPLAASRPNLVAEREGSWHFSDRWRFGEALRFSFRWARNSAFRPYWDGISPGLSIVGNKDDTAVFEFTGQWALLEVIKKQQGNAADFSRLEDMQPHTLKFEIPVRRLLAAKPAPQKQQIPQAEALGNVQTEPEECFLDWYEEAYGDARCLEQGYSKIQNQKTPAQVQKDFIAAKQDTPYPSTVNPENLLTSENLERFNAFESERFQENTQARLFIRFNVSYPNKKELLIVPEFPHLAPPLEGFEQDFALYQKKQQQQRFMPGNVTPASLLSLTPQNAPATAATPAVPTEAGATGTSH
ncbi:type VI secretion protein IcmF/TssM N-terminal domain-containing protein [Candidatus Venteria ishoeyi]|uniref:Type VI secretion system component TssM1 N-terminal domain-containing protein n=1 Tax=Candidatus Venteria ishoeyi TaxID=1899563 RepID=A0A1H6FDE3_9GAMM|nr:type VI secretion system protein [Candidatus Venteria ishoeyi]SEH08092.1 Uncharacterised protein [Candidatus Venteria ishoeyi]